MIIWFLPSLFLEHLKVYFHREYLHHLDFFDKDQNRSTFLSHPRNSLQAFYEMKLESKEAIPHKELLLFIWTANVYVVSSIIPLIFIYPVNQALLTNKKVPHVRYLPNVEIIILFYWTRLWYCLTWLTFSMSLNWSLTILVK